MNAHTFCLSHTRLVIHTQILHCQSFTGTHSVHVQSHKNQTKFRHKVTWSQVTTKQNPPLTEKLPHQPTKQRECVRMIIMTDNKKETNQKPKKSKRKKNPIISILNGQQAYLALSIEAFRGIFFLIAACHDNQLLTDAEVK